MQPVLISQHTKRTFCYPFSGTMGSTLEPLSHMGYTYTANHDNHIYVYKYIGYRAIWCYLFIVLLRQKIWFAWCTWCADYPLSATKRRQAISYRAFCTPSAQHAAQDSAQHGWCKVAQGCCRVAHYLSAALTCFRLTSSQDTGNQWEPVPFEGTSGATGERLTNLTSLTFLTLACEAIGGLWNGCPVGANETKKQSSLWKTLPSPSTTTKHNESEV